MEIVRVFRASIVALALVALLPSPTQAAFPGRNGALVFSAYAPTCQDCQGNTEIYTMKPDSTGLTRLTNNFVVDNAPTWSPDGRRIAFTSTRSGPGSAAIYVMDFDGSNVSLIATIPLLSNKLAWSPDGRKIAFESRDPSHPEFGTEIYTVDVGDGVKTDLTHTALNDQRPTWSPDGTHIAWTTGAGEIWTMRADGTDQTNLTMTPDIAEDEPAWSPSGRKIAFRRNTDPTHQPGIYTMNPDGTASSLIVPDGYPNYDDILPAWSPDGSELALVRLIPDTNCEPCGSGTSGIDIFNFASGQLATVFQQPPGAASIPALDWQPLPVEEHPQSAAIIRVSLVPAFRETISSTQCQARGGQPSSHGPPLSLSSCNPPSVPSVAHFGANGAGDAQAEVVPGDPGTPANEADVQFAVAMGDIRQGSPTGGDYDPSLAGPDVNLAIRMRLSDASNSVAPATVADFELDVPVTCGFTIDITRGSDCSVSTTANAILPGMIVENQETVLQAFRVRAQDVGADGTLGTADDQVFAQQGIYIP